MQVSPARFIALIDEKQCPRLQCVFLNACSTLDLARQIQDALPRLSVLAWDSRVADKAAAAFSRGFYQALGRNCADGTFDDNRMQGAYDAAVAEFEKAGYVWGNPQDATLSPDPKHPTVHGCYIFLAGASGRRTSTSCARD